MTLLELMVASTIALIIVAMTLSTTLANRDAYGYDLVRTKLNQNLRSAFDFLNTEVRQAGERLPGTFPAIEIIDGASGGPDTLILRRNLLDEVLTVCQTVSNAAGADVNLASTAAGVPPACVYGTQTASFTVWHNYRMSEGGTGHVVPAYIYDVVAKAGQYFNFSADSNNSVTTAQTIHRQSGSWAATYPALSTSVYMLSEWKFALSTTAGELDLLQLVENQDDTTKKNIVYGVDNIQFRALMQDGTVKTNFTKNDSWTSLQAIEVTVSGSDTYRGRKISSTLTTQLFPRNVLSN